MHLAICLDKSCLLERTNAIGETLIKSYLLSGWQSMIGIIAVILWREA